MSTGRSSQLARAAGEYLVAAELCRRGFIATTFAGNVPDFDIVATDANWKSTSIQVKTIQTQLGAWQFDARDFLDIKVQKGVQRVLGRVKLLNPNLLWVFVKLIGQGKDEFYICRAKDVQRIVFHGYRKNLEEKKGVRPRNPDSTHHALWPKHLEKFRDNWALVSDDPGN